MICVTFQRMISIICRRSLQLHKFHLVVRRQQVPFLLHSFLGASPISLIWNQISRQSLNNLMSQLIASLLLSHLVKKNESCLPHILQLRKFYHQDPSQLPVHLFSVSFLASETIYPFSNRDNQTFEAQFRYFLHRRIFCLHLSSRKQKTQIVAWAAWKAALWIYLTSCWTLQFHPYAVHLLTFLRISISSI